MTLFYPLIEFAIGLISLILAYVIQYAKLFTQFFNIFLLLGILSIVVGLVTFYYLLKKRKFSNYCKSLNDTCRFRHFLRQQKYINDFTSKTKEDANQNIYNSALHETYIDYFPDYMEVWICIPNNATAKKMLDDNLKSAEQELGSYTDKYIISSHTRKGSYYFYRGEKK